MTWLNPNLESMGQTHRSRRGTEEWPDGSGSHRWVDLVSRSWCVLVFNLRSFIQVSILFNLRSFIQVILFRLVKFDTKEPHHPNGSKKKCVSKITQNSNGSSPFSLPQRIAVVAGLHHFQSGLGPLPSQPSFDWGAKYEGEYEAVDGNWGLPGSPKVMLQPFRSSKVWFQPWFPSSYLDLFGLFQSSKPPNIPSVTDFLWDVSYIYTCSYISRTSLM